MDQDDEIGRPNYRADAIQRAVARQQRRAPWWLSWRNSGDAGAFRIRAALAVAVAAYAWLWPLGWFHVPRWSTFLAAIVAIRSARFAADPQASDLSIWVGNVAKWGGGTFLLWAIPAAYLEMQNSGVIAFLNYILATPA